MCKHCAIDCVTDHLGERKRFSNEVTVGEALPVSPRTSSAIDRPRHAASRHAHGSQGWEHVSQYLPSDSFKLFAPLCRLRCEEAAGFGKVVVDGGAGSVLRCGRVLLTRCQLRQEAKLHFVNVRAPPRPLSSWCARDAAACRHAGSNWLFSILLESALLLLSYASSTRKPYLRHPHIRILDLVTRFLSPSCAWRGLLAWIPHACADGWSRVCSRTWYVLVI